MKKIIFLNSLFFLLFGCKDNVNMIIFKEYPM